MCSLGRKTAKSYVVGETKFATSNIRKTCLQNNNFVQFIKSQNHPLLLSHFTESYVDVTKQFANSFLDNSHLIKMFILQKSRNIVGKKVPDSNSGDKIACNL